MEKNSLDTPKDTPAASRDEVSDYAARLEAVLTLPMDALRPDHHFSVYFRHHADEYPEATRMWGERLAYAGYAKLRKGDREGRSFVEAGRDFMLLACRNPAADQDPYQVLCRAALCFWRLKMPTHALTLQQQAVDRFSDRVDAKLQLAEFYTELGTPDQALQVLAAVTDVKGAAALSLANSRAKALFTGKDYAAVLSDFLPVFVAVKADQGLMYWLGHAAVMLDEGDVLDEILYLMDPSDEASFLRYKFRYLRGDIEGLADEISGHLGVDYAGLKSPVCRRDIFPLYLAVARPDDPVVSWVAQTWGKGCLQRALHERDALRTLVGRGQGRHESEGGLPDRSGGGDALLPPRGPGFE